ncbi:vWA domain-containing protein [Tessaracoccus lubricantis]|uniref:vWA domain-containing protein n=1 Tax=Tessaracoccus lubricantis TaxID=545543 RepID=UPI0031ECE378
MIVVDTSLSMKAENRYTTVVTALESTLEELQPTDHVALITFDDGARVAYQGDRGADPQAILDTLPAEPSGDQTDIGAGLELGLTQLERPDAHAVGALVLVTDGDLDAKPDSPFAEPTSAGWADLKQRAAALDTAELATYALELNTETDAALMTGVFPQTQEIPVGQFAEVLSDLRTELLAFQAKQQVDADLAAGSLSAQFDAAEPLGPGTHEATLRLTSAYAKLPTHLTNLTIERAGTAPVVAEGLPPEVVLAPGETIDLPVTLTVGDWSGAGSELRLAATIGTAWADVLTIDLRTPVELKLESAPLTLAAEPAPSPTPSVESQPSPSPQPVEDTAVEDPEPRGFGLLPWLVLAAVAVLALAFLLFRSRTRLEGSLTILRDGQLVQELLLTGRSVPLAPPPGTGGPSGTVSGISGKAEQVLVKAALPGEKPIKAKLNDGDSVRLGDYELLYTGTRSRVLAKIT